MKIRYSRKLRVLYSVVILSAAVSGWGIEIPKLTHSHLNLIGITRVENSRKALLEDSSTGSGQFYKEGDEAAGYDKYYLL